MKSLSITKYHINILFATLFLCITGCSQPQSTIDIENEVAKINDNINKTEEEYKKYGGVVKSLIGIRLNILKNTKEMLEQKKTGINRFIKISYTVDGKTYNISEDNAKIIKNIDEQIQTEEKNLNEALKELDRSGGLVQAINAMKVATMKNTIAILDQKRTLLKFGIPLFEVSPVAKQEKTKEEKGKITKDETEMKAEIARHEEEQKIQVMRDSLDVVLFKLELLPKNYRVQRFNNELKCGFIYKNKSQKDIRAFTGYTVFKDLFDREFYRARLTYEGTLKANEEKKQLDRVMEMNEFNEAHRKLMTTSLDNMKIEFVHEAILFTDGTKLGNISQESNN